MSIVLPNASASELSGLSGGATSDSSDTSASPLKHRRRCDEAAAFLQPGAHLPRYACPQCALRFRRRDALDRHVTQHTGIRTFRCTLRPDECNRIYSCSSHLRRHVRTAHSADARVADDGSTTTVRCSQPGCPRRFTTPAAMALHAVQTHQKRRQHQCAECPEAFYRKQQLRAHQMKHTGVYPYRCAACASGFLSKRQLERHRTGCKRELDAETATSTTTTASTAQSKNRCEVCDRTFAKWSELVAHRRTEHRPQCVHCSRTFSTLANRRMHMHSVHGATVAADADDPDPDNTTTSTTTTTFVCTEPDCGKQFAHERNLNAHWRLKHGSVRFACDRCGLELSSKKKLELHGDWHRRHPDYVVRPATKTTGQFGCESAGCGRMYVRRQALVEHVRKAHGGEAIVVPAARQLRTVAEKLAGVTVEEDDGQTGEEEAAGAEDAA